MTITYCLEKVNSREHYNMQSVLRKTYFSKILRKTFSKFRSSMERYLDLTVANND